MPLGKFDSANPAAVSSSLLSPPLQMSSYAAPMTQADVLEAGTMSPEVEWPTQDEADIRCLAKGIRWALTIEGVAALCLYAIWHIWLLWR